jgi:serine protease Do
MANLVTLRSHAIVGMIGFASLLGSCGGKAVSSTASAGKAQHAAAPAPAPAADRPAAALTPRTQPSDVAKNLSKAFSATAKAIAPSVVRIDVRAGRPPLAQGERFPQGNPFANNAPPFIRRFFDLGELPDSPRPDLLPGPVSGTGSGIIIDGAGNVVTNSHVVDGSAEIKVTLSDGQEIPAKLTGRDKPTDVAVVRLERVPKNLVSARLGDPTGSRWVSGSLP